jgi:methionyl-tRNA synthetase
MSNTYYITTSIPYVNGEPHLGHAMEFIQADVLARYARQQGMDVILSTGADEHGSKIAETAAKLGKTPLQLTDEMSQKFRDLCVTLEVSNDRFIRTTDKGHEQRAQLIWKNLGDTIYKAKYTGWYDVRQEEFVSEKDIDPARTKPDHPQAYQQIEEENYFFKLSAYTDQIREAIESDALRVVPKTRRNEILSLMKDGLEDISISRPKDKLAWGVPVPGDATQVMYVWFEALMNYITVLGYPEHDDFKTYWPANVHVIGKDINRFHSAIWPGMLLGLGIALPQAVYVHSFINAEGGEKMSKSVGNVVAPQEIISKYGVEAFRYYFLRHIPSYEDGEFSWDRFAAAYNNELANELGNTVQRTVVMLQKYQNGVIGNIPESEHDTNAFETAMKDFRFDRALDHVWEQVRGLNQYIDEAKPWIVAKNDDLGHLQEILAYQVSCLLEIAELLVPFLPDTAAKIKAIFSEGIVRPIEGTLFPRIETTEK